MNSHVYALAVDSSGNLYAGGFFTTAGGVAASRIAKWNGSTWSAMGAGMEYDIEDLAVDSSGNLYAGDRFQFVDNVLRPYLALWLKLSNAWL